MEPTSEIYRYQAPWTVYALNWSSRADKPWRLCVGSFIEEYKNKVWRCCWVDGVWQVLRVNFPTHHPQLRIIIQLLFFLMSTSDTPFLASNYSIGSVNLGISCCRWRRPSLSHHKTTLGATKGVTTCASNAHWFHKQASNYPDLLASTGDFLRLWEMTEEGKLERKSLLVNVTLTIRLFICLQRIFVEQRSRFLCSLDLLRLESNGSQHHRHVQYWHHMHNLEYWSMCASYPLHSPSFRHNKWRLNW